MTRWWRRPTRYAHGLTTNAGSSKGCSSVHAPPIRFRASSTSTVRPARARYAAAVRPLCPAPTTTVSQVVSARSVVIAAPVSGTRCVEDDFAHDFAAFDETVCLAGFRQWQHSIHHRLELSGS